jgi:hypothetical protein
MSRELWKVFAGLGALAISAVWTGPAAAQMAEVKEKAPLYTYVAEWNIPRAQWAEMAKGNAASQKVMDQAVADGTIVGYGSDRTVVHQSDGITHDNWWSAMSMAGVLNVLDRVEKAGDSGTSVLASATDHSDGIYVSHYYNWHPGSWKGGYTFYASYTLRPDAPDDAVAMLSKSMFVPVLEKLLVDGTIEEYEIDTQALHTEAPGTFLIVYLAPNAEGIDKVNAAIREAVKSKPLDGPAFESMVTDPAHRDSLVRSDATYK